MKRLAIDIARMDSGPPPPAPRTPLRGPMLVTRTRGPPPSGPLPSLRCRVASSRRRRHPHERRISAAASPMDDTARTRSSRLRYHPDRRVSPSSSSSSSPASFPFELALRGREDGDPRVVELVYPGTDVVDHTLRFATPVRDATIADLGGGGDHVCVLARGDCVTIHAPDGAVVEAALPFTADRLLPLPVPTSASASAVRGLVLQRQRLSAAAPTPEATAAAFSPSGQRPRPSVNATTTQPRFFALSHPLHEVTPIVLESRSSPAMGPVQFLSDPALEAVGICGHGLTGDLALLVCWHRRDRRFLVYRLRRPRVTKPTKASTTTAVASATATTSFVDATGGAALRSPSFVSPAKHRQQQRELAANTAPYLQPHIVPEVAASLLWASPTLDAFASGRRSRRGIASGLHASSKRDDDDDDDDDDGDDDDQEDGDGGGANPEQRGRQLSAFLTTAHEDHRDDNDQAPDDAYDLGGHWPMRPRRGPQRPLLLYLIAPSRGLALVKPLRISMGPNAPDHDDLDPDDLMEGDKNNHDDVDDDDDDDCVTLDDSDLRVLECRQAVPIARHDADEMGQRGSETIDVIVQAPEGHLELHVNGAAVAGLDLGPASATMGPLELCHGAGAEARAFVVVRPGDGREWHFPHPLDDRRSALCTRIHRILEWALPPAETLAIRVAAAAASTSTSSLPPWETLQEVLRTVVGLGPYCDPSTPLASAVEEPTMSDNDSSSNNNGSNPKRLQTAPPGAPPPPPPTAFERLCRSDFARQYALANPQLLALPTPPPLSPVGAISVPVAPSSALRSFSPRNRRRVLDALHLLHEDLRLSIGATRMRLRLTSFLAELHRALRGRHSARALYYGNNLLLLDAHDGASTTSPLIDVADTSRTMTDDDDDDDVDDVVPDIFVWLRERIAAFATSDLPVFATGEGFADALFKRQWRRCHPHHAHRHRGRRRRLDRAAALLGATGGDDDGDDDEHPGDDPLYRLRAIGAIFTWLFPRFDADGGSGSAARVIAFLCSHPLGARLRLEDLPFGVRDPILGAIRAFQEKPPPTISEDVAAFIGRLDLASGSVAGAAGPSAASALLDHRPKTTSTPTAAPAEEASSSAGPRREVSDGLAEVLRQSQRLFPRDQRLKEVARLVRASRPLCLRLDKTPDLSDQDHVAQQQARLLLLCKRAMALGVARGMVTLGTLDVAATRDEPAWRLAIPPLPLAGRTPPTHATVQLDVSGYAKELTHWPQFHNGCATGLRLPARELGAVLNRYWIKYHRPSAADFTRPRTHGPGPGADAAAASTTANATSAFPSARDLDEAHAAHAGLLLGLGLRGHLACLSMADVYNYLSLANEFVTVAILLGMATTAAHCRRRQQQQQQRRRQRQQQHQQQQGQAPAPAQASEEKTRTAAAAATPHASSPVVLAPTTETREDRRLSTLVDDVDDLAIPASQDEIPASQDVEMELTQTQPETETATASADVAPSSTPTTSARAAAAPALVGVGLELSLERSVSKMLCLHIPSLLPPPFAEFSVPASTQTAALLGLGLLYQGTGHRLMTELLLTEITRSPSSVQFAGHGLGGSGGGGAGSSSSSSSSSTPFDQHEGYSLAAGMALGLVLLGRGRATSGDPGLADLGLEEKLYKYIVGGAQQGGTEQLAPGSCLYRGRRWKGGGGGTSGNSRSGSAAGAGSGASGTAGNARSDPKLSDRQGSTGEHVNIGITASGSSLALGFMYMKTGNRTIAAQLAAPDTLSLLDYVRPDLLLLRTLAKNLVLWDAIEPNRTWIEGSQVPAQLLAVYRILARGPEEAATNDRDGSRLPEHVDIRSVCEAYANIITGACLSIGLRFAGTGSDAARETLRGFVLHFREMRSRSALLGGDVLAAATERVTIERCLGVCAQALALVDAGSGHVETLTLLRSLNLRQRVDSELTYGNHMALSMAIGLLFLGGGRATVARTNEAIAALVIALFPMTAVNTADNKYHLQAFRHLYVLAVDTSRLIETINVHTGAHCSVPIRIERSLGPGRDRQWERLETPCLVPDLATIARITIDQPDEFYPVDIDLTGVPSHHHTTATANDQRVRQLMEHNTILLQPRQRDPDSDPSSLLQEVTTRSPMRSLRTSTAGGFMDLYKIYFGSRDCPARLHHRYDDPMASDSQTRVYPGPEWWAPHQDHLNRLLEATPEATHKWELSSRLSALHALAQIRHIGISLSTIDGLCNLKLLDVAERVAKDRMNSLPLREDFMEWVRDQAEEGLRQRWQVHVGLPLPSLTAARQVLLENDSMSVTDGPSTASLGHLATFYLSALAHFFDVPSSLSLYAPDNLKRLREALIEAGADTWEGFDVSRFLQQPTEALSTEEETFWLRLVSFFLFSV